MTKTLTNSQRDELFQELKKNQQFYVMNTLKRGKKTVFANVIAKSKGRMIPNGATDEEIGMLLDDWILEDYVDAGAVSEEVKCECGRALRYQYIVRHVKTGEMRHFGMNHFEEHTGLPATIVKEVVQGFTKIDYELDELLLKMQNGSPTYDIPEGLNLPADMKEPLSLHLPLLDRQEKRLNSLIRGYREEKEALQRGSNKLKAVDIPKKVKEDVTAIEELPKEELQGSFDLFAEEVQEPLPEKTSEKPKETYFVGDLSFTTQEAIDGYIQQGTESALMICEFLIKEGKVQDKRYSTKKPKIYYAVCTYLDSFVASGSMSVEPLGREDRIYRLKSGRSS
ncbi:DUF3895 domain-containing protein [Guptibacillus hwajinpoensis]|uniref:DUF3895 domain-containing protein n=1 Tax=Guptibacillus hwajinpoensis TaxID=208199 RepID=UPI001CFE30E5|nr:DUF3895 domain-containing protein [Pseudalkalibacillus hwajinpoensis]